MRTKVFQADFVRSQYADLLKDLKLDPQSADRLLELLTNRVASPSKASLQAADDDIRNVLDPDRYEKFKNYQKTLPERQSVSQLRSQLAAGRVAALSEDQEHRLFDAMVEERTTYKAPTSAEFSSDEHRAQYSQWQDENDRRIIERARQILNSEQFEVFNSQVVSSGQVRRAFGVARTTSTNKHE